MLWSSRPATPNHKRSRISPKGGGKATDLSPGTRFPRELFISIIEVGDCQFELLAASHTKPRASADSCSCYFRLKRALHEQPHRLRRLFVFIQDEIHLLDDRHLDAQLLGPEIDRARVAQAFRDHLHLAQDLL
jgi:hypothetical protein